MTSERILNDRNVTLPVHPTRFPVCDRKPSGFTESVY